MDFVCPFSKKQFVGIKKHLLPRLDKSGDLADELGVILRCTPQPWHASSTFVHGAPVLPIYQLLKFDMCWSTEAFLAVVRASPDRAFDFASALFDAQESYFDEGVAGESPKQTKARLAKLAQSSIGLDEAKFLELVSTAKGNSGSAVTDALKLQVKLGRQNGIHVTPTVVLDGLVDPSVSSSFGAEEWDKYVKEKIKA